MLYRPERFDSLTDEPWSDASAREAIRRIVADADQAYDPERLWPAHEWDAWNSPLPMKNLYVGAAGVIWALDALRRRGHAESRLDIADAARRALLLWRDEPDFSAGVPLPANAAAGLLCGESGILAVAWRVTEDTGLADDLFARVKANVEDEASEVMWGTPGTMLAARAMLDWTADERWADAWRESSDALLRRRDAEGLWLHRLYGEAYRGLGPPHGVVGNVAALLGGRELLAHDSREAVAAEAARVLERSAVIEDGLANWPMVYGGDLVADDGEVRLQWDCGAPGVVASAASYLDEELVLAGAELTWQAGPHGAEKGAGICHGTAGNGYAFLKAFERTGDECWLDRARRFAVHALGQVGRARAQRGTGRYSLWTGDVGVALYAADCLDARTAYPIAEAWDY